MDGGGWDVADELRKELESLRAEFDVKVNTIERMRKENIERIRSEKVLMANYGPQTWTILVRSQDGCAGGTLTDGLETGYEIVMRKVVT